jgi:23S rRNA (adenine2030-N6)-methyltransferase
MLSYLHGFHAGSHADVLKHTVLLAILDRLTAKPKPLRYVETHAGAGGYDPKAAAAQKNREHAGGIGKLWQAAAPPVAVARLVELVRRYNDGRQDLTRYPGSPWLARAALRREDDLYLFELHPTEHRRLVAALGDQRNVTIAREDGFASSIGLVPPPSRRGAVLLDPSYETKDESARLLDALGKAHRRFASGVYAIWYPVIERRWVERFERAVRAAAVAPFDLYELSVAPDGAVTGLSGSGMIVVNPPWTLRAAMEEALPWLAHTLAIGGAAAPWRIASEPRAERASRRS